MLGINKSTHYKLMENRYVPSGGEREAERRSTPPEKHDARKPGIKPPPGTDLGLRHNPTDDTLPRLLHHRDVRDRAAFYSSSDTKKNYRVLYDPETDKTLLKAERKSKQKKIRFNGEGVGRVGDPRRHGHSASQYFLKPNKRSKKFAFKVLPQPRFTFDKNSLGEAPRSQLVVWNLPLTTSEVYLVNFFQSYGDPIKDVKFINDPDYGVPLGIVTFTFAGTPDKAMRSAVRLLRNLKAAQPKIDGVDLMIALNDNDNHLLQSKIDACRAKVREAKLKRDEEERKKQKALEEKRREEQKRKDAELKKLNEERARQPRPNSTITSIRSNHKIVPGVFMPGDLKRYIKDRPYILIHNRYVPTQSISSQDVKKVLNKYNWTRVLSDKTGFYVVFNSFKECERCFYAEDGRRFYEFRMYMELAIPEKYDLQDDDALPEDAVDEATNLLIKEFQLFLSKDIRERVIAPYVLDLLNPANYPELVKELKEKQELERKQHKPAVVAYKPEISQQTLTLPSFKKKNGAASLRAKRKNIIPLQHALNYDDDSDSDDDLSRSVTPAPKRDRDDADDEPPAKKSKLAKTFLYESSDDEEDDDDIKEEVPDEETPPSDFAHLDEKYQPSFVPEPVYGYELMPEALDIDGLRTIIKDDEDMQLLQKVLSNVEPANIGNIDYWAWKQVHSTASAVIEEADGLEGPLSTHLECATGSFRSEGYRKINDADKIEYLPHRRKIHKPLKTVQHDSDDTPGAATSAANNNNVQSSRVNRANNRRFAADIEAQKQMLGSETDILNLNALTKRKKPVSFARSAIHNWGLYALEPIAAKEMIIEYVGESIRQQVAEHRERSYLKTGIGSSYLFRIDENTVIDATKKGGIARFINHCCNPSCTAKIIKVDGKKRIVIYALRDVEANEELTYDYKFERETNDEERIRCLCGAPGCKGYLN